MREQQARVPDMHTLSFIDFIHSR